MAENQKLLDSGELLIRTDEGIYFLAPHKGATPLLIDAEEGELLFSKVTSM